MIWRLTESMEKGDTRHTPELVATAFAAALATLPEVPNLREGLCVIFPHPSHSHLQNEHIIGSISASADPDRSTGVP
jgi:hypothetical protein